MRVLLVMIVAIGCGRTPIEPAPKEAGVADAAPTEKAAPPSSAVDPARRATRLQDFHRQKHVVVPDTFFPEMRALLPKTPHKLVACGMERHMALTQPAPGRRKAMLRWATPLVGEALLKSLSAHLTANGWTVRDRRLRAPIVDPVRGRLQVEIEELPERASRVKLVLETVEPGNAPPVENPLLLLQQPVPWLDDAVATMKGFEYAWLHGVRFVGAATDVQRVALTVETQSAQARDALRMRLEDRAQQAGFAPTSKKSGVFRTSGGSVFTTRPTSNPRQLVVHLQQRWKR